ncbi:uncharacterized protein LOC121394769 isoform X2 [Xenopus laevis]|nr:uncharacterized protein LOC121394769 isoform X2 [Xenopus laevis]
MPKCIVNGCPHRSGQKLLYPDVVLHPFPKNIERIKNWLLQTGQHAEDLEPLAQRILLGWKTSNFRMCSKHFTEESYTQSGSKRILKNNAVPTVFENVHVPVTTVITVPTTPSAIPSAKRRRVDDEQPTTSSTIIRAVSRLSTIATQTDPTMNTNNVACMACTICKNCSTQTKRIITKEIATQSGDEYIAADVVQIHKDHLYPVSFSTPSKPIDKPIDILSPIQSSVTPSNIISTPRAETSSITADSFILSSPSFVEPKDSTFDIERLSSSDDTSSGNDTIKQSEEQAFSTDKFQSKKKFIIYDNKLDELLRIVRCQHNVDPPCQAPIVDFQKTEDGSMLTVKLYCFKWSPFSVVELATCIRKDISRKC